MAGDLPSSRGNRELWWALGASAATCTTAVVGYLLYKRKEKISSDSEIVNGFPGLIGNTPMLHLKSLSEATGCTILAKAEFLNPGGSSKDRIAKRIIEEAEENGLLPPGGTICEGTSGSTGISLALIARAKGYKCHIVMPDDVAEEKSELLERFGAKIERVRPASIVHPGNYVNVAKIRASEIPGGYFCDQFENLANFRAHYEGTGEEIWRQTRGTIDAFVMSSGTGGTISGAGACLKEHGKLAGRAVQVFLADPPGSALFHKVASGVLYASEQAEAVVRRHRYDTIAEGVGLDRITANFHAGLRLGVFDGAYRVSDREAVEMSQYLLRHEGLFVGSSSSLNCVAAVRVARKLGPGHTIVTVLCDGGQRHLTKFHSPSFLKKWDLTPTPRSADTTDVRSELDFISASEE